MHNFRKMKLLFTTVALIISLNIFGQLPRVKYKNYRSIPSDSTWIDIYQALYAHDNVLAKTKYDSISQLYLANENYTNFMFLSNEYSYWLRLIGGKAKISAEFLENSLNTVLTKLNNDDFELLYAYYDLILHTVELEQKLKWGTKYFLLYDKIFPNNELLDFAVSVHMTCGGANYHLNRVEEAWRHWDYARAHIDEVRGSLWIIKGLASMVKMSQPKTVLPLFKYVYDNLENSHNWQKKFTATGNYIVQLNRVGDYEKAVEYGEKGLEFFENHLEDIKKGMRPHAVIHLALIDAYMDTGNFDKAFEVMEKTHAVLDQLSYQGQTLSALEDDKKRWFSKNGMIDSAFVYLDRAYKIDVEKKTDPEYIVYNYMDNSIPGYLEQYGDYYAYKHEYHTALDFYKRALRASNMKHYSHIEDTTYLIPPNEFQSINTKSVMMTIERLQDCNISLYKETEDFKILYEMIDYCNYGNAILKEQFKTLASRKMVLSISKLLKTNNSFGLFACSQLAKKNHDFVDSAFLYADMPNAFSLNYLKQLKNRTITDKQDSLIIEVGRLSLALANYRMEKDSVTRELIDLTIDLLRAKMLLSDNSQYESKIIDIEPNISIIKQNLPPNEAIIKYVLADSTLYTICYTQNNSVLKTISVPGISTELRKLKRKLKSGIVKPEETQVLYNYLMDPLDNILMDVKHVNILIDEQFNGTPLEVLFDFNNHPLVARFAVKYYNSAKNMEQNVQIEPRTILAIAPIFKDNNVFVAANVSRSSIYSSEIFNIRDASACLSPIISSLEEVRFIENECVNSKIETTILSSGKATEANFKKESVGKDIIHIATHGISGSEFESGLFFTYTEGGKEDGFLRLPEIYKMNLNADLVVLSACKTGTGEIIEGEGVMALPRGFIYAGVPNVIASLWKVHDEKTKDLMVAFYTHLLEDKVNYAEALRLAKLDCIARGFLPIDWAGFILIGN